MRNEAPNNLSGEELTSCEVAGDGSRTRFGFRSAGGRNCMLDLPTSCLQSLMMFLPNILERAFRLQYQDDGLRLVYPTEAVRIEQSSDPRILIVTLTTPDAFAMSFGLTHQQLQVFRNTESKVQSTDLDSSTPN